MTGPDVDHDRSDPGGCIHVEITADTITDIHVDEHWRRRAGGRLLGDLVTEAVHSAAGPRREPDRGRREPPVVSSRLATLRRERALELNRRADQALAALTEALERPDEDATEVRESSSGRVTMILRHGGFSSVAIEQAWAEAAPHQVVQRDLAEVLHGVPLGDGLPGGIRGVIADVQRLHQDLTAMMRDVR